MGQQGQGVKVCRRQEHVEGDGEGGSLECSSEEELSSESEGDEGSSGEEWQCGECGEEGEGEQQLGEHRSRAHPWSWGQEASCPLHRCLSCYGTLPPAPCFEGDWGRQQGLENPTVTL